MAAISITFPIPSTTSVAPAQTLSGAGALTLVPSGSLWGNNPVTVSTNYERTLSLTSTGNLSAVNFTIVGKGVNGSAVTEVLAGPNNNTVYSVNFYASITSITASAAVATAVSAGTGTTGQTKWVYFSGFQNPFNVGFGCEVTGTINYTIQHTFDDIQSGTPVAFVHDDPTLNNATTNQNSNYVFRVNASRAVINSSGSTGALTTVWMQSGLR